MAKSKKTATATAEPTGHRYCFKGGGFSGVNVQAVGEELAALEIKPGDCHRTADVLQAARDVNSPLHGCFTWDDDEAADKHRLSEARKLLRSIAYVIVKNEKREARSVYWHVKDEEGPRYVRTEKVATDAQIRAAALDEALSVLAGFRRRYDFLLELKPLFSEIDKISSNHSAKKKGGKKK